MTERARCGALNKLGEPCRAFSVGPDGLCWIHSLSVEQRKAQSARGGRQKGRAQVRELPVDFDTVCWILEFVISVVNSRLTPRRAAELMAPLLAPTPGE